MTKSGLSAVVCASILLGGCSAAGGAGDSVADNGGNPSTDGASASTTSGGSNTTAGTTTAGTTTAGTTSASSAGSTTSSGGTPTTGGPSTSGGPTTTSGGPTSNTTGTGVTTNGGSSTNAGNGSSTGAMTGSDGGGRTTGTTTSSVTTGSTSAGTTAAGTTGTTGARTTTGSTSSSSTGTTGARSTTGTTGTSGTTGSTTTGTTGAAAMCPTVTWPTATGTTQQVSSTIKVSGTYDGALKRYVSNGLGTGDQSEGQSPLFEIASGGTLKNVIIGAPAADGVHCLGACTINNVWWEDVGEDALTLKGNGNATIDTGGAMHATDKILQHNGGGTLTVKNFYAYAFGKFYRSCGNCSSQPTRNIVLQNVILQAPGSEAVGINANYNDTAKFTNVTICDNSKKMVPCATYTGNNSGDEPTLLGTGPDGKNCIYAATDITWIP